MPRCFAYQAPSAFGSALLRNTPPTPVTLAMSLSPRLSSTSLTRVVATRNGGCQPAILHLGCQENRRQRPQAWSVYSSKRPVASRSRQGRCVLQVIADHKTGKVAKSEPITSGDDLTA